MENRKVEIEQRQAEIEHLEKEKGKIQDEIFADFCKHVGIPNIR